MGDPLSLLLGFFSVLGHLLLRPLRADRVFGAFYPLATLLAGLLVMGLTVWGLLRWNPG
jgi:hypothetical protein